ncbi:TPA: hypothetical protein OLY09_003343 [Clostridioides difficile]|nr:hypothetical protein [Clostridioides difficile]
MININDLVIETLKPLKIPVSFQRFDGEEKTYITFFSYLEQNRYADDEVVGTEHYIQIDLFSKNKMSYINKEIERLLKKNNFIKRSIHEIKESDYSYHTIFRFLFLQKKRRIKKWLL